ncbi:methionine--tRNA ligase mes1, partial [Coemansia nantahalensis]
RYGGVLPAADPALVAPGAGTEDRCLIDDVNVLLARYTEQMDGVHIRAALGTARDIAARGNQYLQKCRLDNALFNGSRAQCDTVLAVAANLIYLLSAVFHPFIPGVAADISAQLNAPLRLIPDALELDLKPGHVLGRPKHLFTHIDDRQIDEWRALFGGKQSA